MWVKGEIQKGNFSARGYASYFLVAFYILSIFSIQPSG